MDLKDKIKLLRDLGALADEYDEDTNVKTDVDEVLEDLTDDEMQAFCKVLGRFKSRGQALGDIGVPRRTRKK